MSDANFESEARASGWRTIRRVAPYLWPDAHPWVKKRVVLAMIALFLSKIIAVGTPFFYKAAVDALGGESTDAAWMLGAGAVGLTVAYGVARPLETRLRERLTKGAGAS